MTRQHRVGGVLAVQQGVLAATSSTVAIQQAMPRGEACAVLFFTGAIKHTAARPPPQCTTAKVPPPRRKKKDSTPAAIHARARCQYNKLCREERLVLFCFLRELLSTRGAATTAVHNGQSTAAAAQKKDSTPAEIHARARWQYNQLCRADWLVLFFTGAIKHTAARRGHHRSAQRQKYRRRGASAGRVGAGAMAKG